MLVAEIIEHLTTKNGKKALFWSQQTDMMTASDESRLMSVCTGHALANAAQIKTLIISVYEDGGVTRGYCTSINSSDEFLSH